MFIVTFSGGEYSDYWERWYQAVSPLTHAELGHLMKATCVKTEAEYERISQENQVGMWDECYQLFGVKKWPWSGKFLGEKGTEAEFYAWRDKWAEKDMDFLDMWLQACGLSRLKPDLEVDTVAYISALEDRYDAMGLCNALIGRKKMKPQHNYPCR